MINFDDITKEYIKDHNANRPQILDRIFIIGGYRSGKKNSLFNLKNHQPDIDKIIYVLKIHMKKNANC